MRRIAMLLLLAAAASARADTLADVKRTLAALHGTAAINATFEARHTNKASGRFFTQNLNVHSMAEVHGGEEGIRVTLSRATLERLRAQRAAGQRDDTDASEVAGDVAPAQVAELLDYAPSLQATLARAVLVGEREAALGSVPARLLAFKVPLERPRAKEVKLESKGDDLSLWVGRDGVPLAAERKAEFSAGFLFLKVTGGVTDKWTFARRDDRLVVTHHERTDSGGGMGQTSEGTDVQNIALR